jgi:hypothetical protein
MPEPLRRIEIRRIGRKRKHRDLPIVFAKKFKDFGLLVVGSVILNQIDSMAPAVIMRQQLSVDERQISLGVEVFGLVPPEEITGRHTDRPQDFLSVAFSARGNLRLLPAPRPSPIKSRRLSKGRFILINDYRPSFRAFFLDSGACSESIGFVSWDRLAPIESWAVARKSSTASTNAAHVLDDSSRRILPR